MIVDYYEEYPQNYPDKTLYICDFNYVWCYIHFILENPILKGINEIEIHNDIIIILNKYNNIWDKYWEEYINNIKNESIINIFIELYKDKSSENIDVWIVKAARNKKIIKMIVEWNNKKGKIVNISSIECYKIDIVDGFPTPKFVKSLDELTGTKMKTNRITWDKLFELCCSDGCSKE